MAQCVWPRNIWVAGDGAYATVSYCRTWRRGSYITVELHATLEDADLALRMIDTGACGGACQGRHDLVRLVLPS